MLYLTPTRILPSASVEMSAASFYYSVLRSNTSWCTLHQQEARRMLHVSSCDPILLQASAIRRNNTTHQQQRRLTPHYSLAHSYMSSGKVHQERKDPLAQKPNKLCDPYGQGGKPLDYQQVKSLLRTLEEGWSIISSPIQNEEMTVVDKEAMKEVTSRQEEHDSPKSIYKEYRHDSYLQGSKFISSLASLCHVHDHFGAILLERRLVLKRGAPSSWDFVTTVTCTTDTLGGLSYNDFHLAMMIDVECTKMKHLFLPGFTS